AVSAPLNLRDYPREIGLDFVSFTADAAGDIYLADGSDMQVIELGPDGVERGLWDPSAGDSPVFVPLTVEVSNDGSQVYTFIASLKQARVFASSANGWDNPPTTLQHYRRSAAW